MMRKTMISYRRTARATARDIAGHDKNKRMIKSLAALLALALSASAMTLPMWAKTADPEVQGISEVTSKATTAQEKIQNQGEVAVTRPIASRTMESALSSVGRRLVTPSTAGRSRIYYPYPWGAMAVTLYLNGQRVLFGEVAEIDGKVYVPVQRYADLFGSFKTTYVEATEQVTINGTNLQIRVRVGDPYITVNDRIFYTGNKVLSLGGWIFVPIEAMSKALGATVYIKKGYYEAYVTSGNPTALPWASEYYNSTDLYWLSRIISAEAKGEPLEGQIAVGNVVLNRVRNSTFPNTVKGVIFDKKYGVQFSPVSNGTIYNTPVASATLAAKICLEGYTLSSRALYFFNPSLTSATWISNNRPYIMTIGNHKFYG